MNWKYVDIAILLHFQQNKVPWVTVFLSLNSNKHLSAFESSITYALAVTNTYFWDCLTNHGRICLSDRVVVSDNYLDSYPIFRISLKNNLMMKMLYSYLFSNILKALQYFSKYSLVNSEIRIFIKELNSKETLPSKNYFSSCSKKTT